MKRFLLVLMALMMVFSMAACGGEGGSEKKTGGLYEVAAFNSTLSQGSVADLKGTVSDYIDTTQFGKPSEYEDGTRTTYYRTSDDVETPLDFTVTLAGEKISLPASISAVNKANWNAELPDVEVDAYSGGMWLFGKELEFTHSSGAVASLGMFNLEKEKKDLKDCKVCSVTVEHYNMDHSNDTVVVTENVPTFEINGTLNNESTLKQVLETLGTPSTFVMTMDVYLEMPVYEAEYAVEHGETQGSVTWVFAKDAKTLLRMEYENF